MSQQNRLRSRVGWGFKPKKQPDNQTIWLNLKKNNFFLCLFGGLSVNFFYRALAQEIKSSDALMLNLLFWVVHIFVYYLEKTEDFLFLFFVEGWEWTELSRGKKMDLVIRGRSRISAEAERDATGPERKNQAGQDQRACGRTRVGARQDRTSRGARRAAAVSARVHQREPEGRVAASESSSLNQVAAVPEPASRPASQRWGGGAGGETSVF